MKFFIWVFLILSIIPRQTIGAEKVILSRIGFGVGPTKVFSNINFLNIEQNYNPAGFGFNFYGGIKIIKGFDSVLRIYEKIGIDFVAHQEDLFARKLKAEDFNGNVYVGEYAVDLNSISWTIGPYYEPNNYLIIGLSVGKYTIGIDSVGTYEKAFSSTSYIVTPFLRLSVPKNSSSALAIYIGCGYFLSSNINGFKIRSSVNYEFRFRKNKLND